MEYEEYFMRRTPVTEVEFRVFLSVHPTNADEIGSFLSGLFRKMLSHLNKNARAVCEKKLYVRELM